MGTCLHEHEWREKRQYGFFVLLFSFSYFLVAEEKGGERTYDTTDG